MVQIKNKNSKNLLTKRNGFILLLGILIATVLFSIGVAFSTIVYKELILAFTARESQISFYAADVGIDCVKYWDNYTRDPRFGPGVGPFKAVAPFDDDSERNSDDVGKIECAGSVFILDDLGQYDFVINNEDYCDSVVVNKQVIQGVKMSIVRSWGFNNCDPEFPRRTDRAIEARYRTL
jgi:hypothetical protein